MPALNKAKRNFTVSLVTSIGLVALLLYYILGYLPRNQQRLEARNFRVLSRIGDNLHHSIQASVTGLNKMARRTVKQDQDTINQAFLKELYTLVEKHQHETPKESLKTNGAVHLYRNIYDDYVHVSAGTSGSESTHRGSTNSYELHFKVANYHYAKSLNQLIAPLLRDDVFQEFYIFKDPGTDINTAALKADHIIYSTSLIGINFFKPVTQDGPLKGIAGNVLDFDLAGQAYKLFVVKQEIGYGQKWILCGAIPTSEYNRQRMAIPNDTIGFVVLGLVLLVLSLPFVKLALLGEKERMGMSSIGLCFLSLFLGASILLLLWLNATTYWGRDNDVRKTQLEALATNVESSVKGEISMILDQMAVFDNEIIDSNKPIYFRGDSDSVVWKATTYRANNAKAAPYYTNYYPFFTRLSWIDKQGNQLRTFSKNGKRSPLINVKTRPYFRKIMEGDSWKLKEREEGFYLNAVKSWLDGENYVIISQKSAGKFADAVCITITTKLVSLTQAILPPHFGFLIINEEGEVLFHSNNKLNLNENFLEETEDNFQVRATLQNKTDHYFSDYYQGSKKNIYIKPIADLPLFVISYVDKDHIKFRYLLNFVLSNSLFIFYFILIATLLGLLLLVAIQPAKIPFYQLSLTWLRPQQRHSTVYKKLNLFLVLTIVLIVAHLSNRTSDTVFLMLLLAPFYVLYFAYYSLNSLSKAIIRVNAIARRIIWFIRAIIGLLNLANILVATYLYPNLAAAFMAYLPVVVFQVLLVVGWYLLTKAFRYADSGQAPARSNYHFEKYYFILVLLLICLTSTVPTVIFYKDAYNRESELMLQYHQLYLDNAIEKNEQNYPLDPGTKPTLTSAEFVNAKSRIYANFFYNTTHLHPETPKQNKAQTATLNNANIKTKKPFAFTLLHKPYTKEDPSASLSSKTDKAQNEETFPEPTAFTPVATTKNEAIISYFFNNICPALHQLLGNASSENGLVCQNEPAEQERFVYNQNTLYLKVREGLLPQNNQSPNLVAGLEDSHFISQVPYFNLLPRFWLNALLFLGFLLFLVKYLVRRIFNIKFTANLKLKKVDEKLLEDFSFQKLLLVALPGTFEDNQTRFRQLIPDYDNYRMVYINLATSHDFKAQLPYMGAKHKVIVWVKHFDYQILQKEAIFQKIKLLEYLKKDNYAKIILQTSAHPATWEEKWKKNELPAEIQDDMRQLLSIMSEYWKVFLPLQVAETLPEQSNALIKIPHTDFEYEKDILQQLVFTECRSCPFLMPLQPLLLEYIEQQCAAKMLQKSDIILKIQSLAQLYYRMLWSSCTKEEQYILYDMAHDGIINARNLSILTSLLSKGLLVKDENHMVRLFNQSFQSFILTIVSPEEALQFEKEKNEGSRWEIYKVPLLIILIGVAAFIFFTQQETWVTVLALLTGVSTLLNLFPRFGVLLPALFLKKEAK